MNKLSYFAPATAANLAAGFEIFGMALEGPGDIVTIEKASHNSIEVISISGDRGKLPSDPKKNTAAVAVSFLLKHLNLDQGLNISIEKHLPLCSGMGSSAASAAAAVAAANELLEANLPLRELVPFAMEAERVACGSAHADNVAPSLLGGITLIRSYYPLDIINLPFPENLHYALVNPNIEIDTKSARALVPQKFSQQQTVSQTGNAAAFVTALATGNYELLKSSCEDFLAEPYRASLIAGFSLVKQAALDAGATGAGLSGSGPSMFAFSDSLSGAKKCADAMQEIFQKQQIQSKQYVSKIPKAGARKITPK